MSIILLGFKGVGKTFFGEKLSTLLSLPWIDTDRELLSYFGATHIFDLYQALGESQFRLAEKNLIEKLTPSSFSIISLGGGSLSSQEAQIHLRRLGSYVYLKASWNRLQTRITKTHLTHIFDLYQRRIQEYQTLPPDLTIDTDPLSEEMIIQRLVSYTQAIMQTKKRRGDYE